MILGGLGGFQHIHPSRQPRYSVVGGGLTMLTETERERSVLFTPQDRCRLTSNDILPISFISTHS